MFGSILEDTVTGVKGGHAAILMGFDGIALDTYAGEFESDIETIGMEFSVLIKEVRNAAEQLETGETSEITVRTDKLSTIIRLVNEDYFLALAVSADGNVGKGRYLLRMAVPKLIELL